MIIFEYLNKFIEFCITYIGNLPIIGILLIMVESIIPILPLSLFIAFNSLVFGYVFGFVLSYISTCIGCIIAFTLARKFGNLYNVSNNKLINRMNRIKFTNLVLITSMPFTPAFLINICSGLSKMDKNKFIANILISKIFVVLFFSYIGKSLFDSITNPYILINISIFLIIAYILSLIIKKVFKIE